MQAPACSRSKRKLDSEPEVQHSIDSVSEKSSIVTKARVILYTRPGCHLCDEAKIAMLAARCDDEYTLDEVNIESDPRLLHAYRHDIPVIFINGIEAFRHRVATEDFRRRLFMGDQSESDIPQTKETP